MNLKRKKINFSQIYIVLLLLCSASFCFAQTKPDEKAEAVIKKAVENLGGEKYLNAKSQIGRGKFSVLGDGAIVSFQKFIDVISFPDKERTEFKGGAAKTVQVNTGKSGWIFDGDALTIKDQTEEQINNFKRGIRTSLDNFCAEIGAKKARNWNMSADGRRV